jgi:hypothetical protein
MGSEKSSCRSRIRTIDQECIVHAVAHAAYSHEHGILGIAGPSIFWLTPSHHTVYPELDWFRLLEIQVFALTARQDYGGSNGKSSIGFAPRFRNRICR